jgi:hypothetical protein
MECGPRQGGSTSEGTDVSHVVYNLTREGRLKFITQNSSTSLDFGVQLMVSGTEMIQS